MVKLMTKKDSWVQLKHDFSINIPADLHQIASFIFMEQETWMEVDVRFIETLSSYVKTVIDVGANYGFYSLLMAKSGSKDICIHAIEPNSKTMSHLRQSINKNKFDAISTHELAFSNFEGQASLTNPSNPELSELNLECDDEQPMAKVSKLDTWIAELDSSSVDFIKLDAEGSEVSIVEGGKAFFDSQDPLIMFELKHGQRIQTELIETLENIEYEIFQYWPGINCLVPVNTRNSEKIDPMRLNLYAAKPSRQKILTEHRLLFRNSKSYSSIASTESIKSSFHEKLGLDNEQLSNWYESSIGLCKKIFQAVTVYEDESLDIQFRIDALYEAEKLVGNLKSFERLTISEAFSLIRVSKDLGNYSYAATIALKMLQRIQSGERIHIKEPFVSPDVNLEQRIEVYSINQWVQLALVETLELYSTFSGIFSADSSLNRCDILDRFGFLSPTLNRRYILLKKLIRGELTPLTKESLSCSLNKAFWQNYV